MKGDLLPGRELDALVAQKVMKSFVPAGSHPQLHDDAWVDRGDFVWEPPSYSTSIDAAWQVVERVTESCKFNLSMGMFGLYWNAAFYIGTSFETVTATTAPHAICLAALKTVEAR
ncbi:MAG: hypothetical protein MRJ68_19375 [Nitrospira sp.]|nr:hypothetical protein [Nitrospira sp.]